MQIYKTINDGEENCQKGRDPDVSDGEKTANTKQFRENEAKTLVKEENEFTLTNENSDIELCASWGSTSFGVFKSNRGPFIDQSLVQNK